MIQANANRLVHALILSSVAVLSAAACSADGGDTPTSADVSSTARRAHIAAEPHAGITLPLTGITDQGGKVQGTTTIAGAGFDEALGPLLIAYLNGICTNSYQTGGRDAVPVESVCLNFGRIEFDYRKDTRAGSVTSDEDCIELTVQIPSAFDAETKQTIHFDEIHIATATLPGPGNLIAELICANDRVAASWGFEEEEQ